jgi:hypothetical protein
LRGVLVSIGFLHSSGGSVSLARHRSLWTWPKLAAFWRGRHGNLT